MSVCVSCIPFQALQTTFADVYVNSYEIVGPYLSELMVGAVGITMVYGIAQALWRPGNVIVELYVRNITMWVMISFLLLNASGWWTFFHALAETGPWLGIKVSSNYSNITVQNTGLVGMMETIEVGFYEKLSDAYSVLGSNVSIFQKLSSWASSVLLAVIYLIVLFQLISGILLSYFKIVAIGTLSPFVVFFLAFDPTRSISIAAIRVLLAATLELFMACIVTAAILFLFQQIYDQTRLDETVTAFQSGGNYLLFLMTGLAMLLIHRVFTDVISQITLTFGATAQAHWGGIMRRVLGQG